MADPPVKVPELLPDTLDEHGAPTTDTASALRGMLLPAGGHKGIGIAMMVEPRGIPALRVFARQQVANLLGQGKELRVAVPRVGRVRLGIEH